MSDQIAHLPLFQKHKGLLVHFLAGETRGKYLLKYGVGTRCLPPEIIRKKKGGFDPPQGDWLRDAV